MKPWNMSALRARSFRVRRAVFVAPIGSRLPLVHEGEQRETCKHGLHVCLPCGWYYQAGSMTLARPRELDPELVDFTMTACIDEDLEIDGNASASGDDEEDERVCEEIRARLDRGDVWAWCWVKITATYTDPKYGELAVDDAIGGCNFRDEADFMAAYGDDMKAGLLAQLEELINP